MNIRLTSDIPINSSPRRFPIIEKEIINQQIEQWLKDKIILPSTSEYSSPVVLVKKKDGSSRLCIDYRRLNKITVREHFPLPLIDDLLDRLQSANIFTTLDLKNAFFHVDIDPSLKKYTSFVTDTGQYEFNKMSFGLSNSPSVFQRYIYNVFRDLIKENVVMIYFDDLVTSENETQGIERLQRVLKTASEYGLELNIKKCQFLKHEIEFLGHRIKDGKLYASPLKIKAVMNFPEPKCTKDIKSYLGLTGYFRKFIPHYSAIAKPLSNLLKKDNNFSFGLKERESFNELKQILKSIQHLSVTTSLPRANGQVERLNSTVIAVISKLSKDDPTKWFKFVPELQRILNSTYQRSINLTPSELLVGVKMRDKTDLKIRELIKEEIRSNFQESRANLRKDAKQQILKEQESNRKTYNLRRKPPNKYKINDIVAIKRTQHGPGLKFKSKFLGPYKITKIKPNDTYDVKKIGFVEGPVHTSTSAEYLKPWSDECAI
ncbi:Transposon Ty3-I Gag-Pol polyprotein [Araneus ventricosus]|uniref:RNA-directed DNA polymerase n=1 Tax=Araneus ventricosus TaxID=182803 RepID=A0A4Y2HLG2_ARAVE|nr:Transposon Ty3-I Gag-Pol polyprotein [Araneus ventricosus]